MPHGQNKKTTRKNKAAAAPVTQPFATATVTTASKPAEGPKFWLKVTPVDQARLGYLSSTALHMLTEQHATTDWHVCSVRKWLD